MATPVTSAPYGSKELFRYVRVAPLEVVDLAERAQASRDVKAVLGLAPAEQKKWARDFLRSGEAVATPADLKFDYFSKLKIAAPDAHFLPTNADIAKLADFDGASAAKEAAYVADRANTLRTTLAYKLLGDDEGVAQASKLLQFVEAFPGLAKVEQRRRYAPAVLERFALKRSKKESKADHEETADQGADKKKDLLRLGRQIELLWRAQDAELKAHKAELEALHKEDIPRPALLATGTAAKGKSAKSRKLSNNATAAARAYLDDLRQRKAKLADARQAFQSKRAASNLHDAISTPAAALARHLPGMNEKDVAAAQADVAKTKEKYDLTSWDFQEAYDEANQLADTIPSPSPLLKMAGCFAENPDLRFTSEVRLMGKGQLVKVEEEFVEYIEGEISYVENILAGERRKRRVKDTKYFEQVEETTTEETTDLTRETGSTTSQELSSQIESEINTRFNTDVNASASGSGGGTIGVVNLNGNASLNAGMGIGVDTKFGTSSKSDFSQEIVSKSIEKAKKTTLKRRMTRSYSLYETLNLHEIDNRGGSPSMHRRGVYCFLDKHIRITESTYGYRLFLLANVFLPGKNLLCEVAARMALEASDVGQRPIFRITPNDVQPGTYMTYVGQYGAPNIQPPPATTIKLARTYKTDQTSAVMEGGSGLSVKTVANVLVPFFEQYKRFLVTETIQIPDGYQVQNVQVTVNHGANGLSIPAHLPLTLAGATVVAAPLLAYSAIIPIYSVLALWQIAYLASPLAHYNVDSSNVTVCIGNESQDSAYYFFEPDMLVTEIFKLLGNFAALTPALMQSIKDEIETLRTGWLTNVGNVSTEAATMVQDSLNTVVGKVNDVFSAVRKALDPTVGEVVPKNELRAIGNAMVALVQSVAVSSEQLKTKLGDLFKPLESFFNKVIELIVKAIESSVSDFFSFLMAKFHNSERLTFTDSFGARKELPISLNAVAIKPGITVNLVVTLRKTDEALAQWQLETFNSLYQAYQRQLADYESRNFSMSGGNGLSKSPGTMRQEENLMMKELILHALNNYHENKGNAYDLARMNLFEHAVDWKNISYKLFNYGPNLGQVALEHKGAFQGVDDRRKAFMTAHWAQALIPLREDLHFEDVMLKYFETGETNLEGSLEADELTALYQSLILDREAALVDPDPVHRFEILPTDFIVLKPDDSLPANPAIAGP